MGKSLFKIAPVVLQLGTLVLNEVNGRKAYLKMNQLLLYSWLTADDEFTPPVIEIMQQ